MRIKRRWLVVTAAIVLILLAPVFVGAAEVAWGTPPGGRVDDVVFESGSFSAFPGPVCYMGPGPVVGANASWRVEAWLEDTIGGSSPLVRIHDRRLSLTMGNLRTMATACESYSIDHVDYPSVRSVEELRALLVPTYVDAIATRDAWGRPFAFESDGRDYRIASSGADRCWERPGLQHAPNGAFDRPTHRQLLGDLVRRLIGG